MQFSCIQILSFTVFMQSSDNHEKLGEFFSNDPEFMNDLMKVLQYDKFNQITLDQPLFGL